MTGICRSALSGMLVQRTRLDTLANNVANMNTTGFKRSRVESQDQAYEAVLVPTGGIDPEEQAMRLGGGTMLAGIQRLFAQGAIQPTDQPTDLAIQGEGFFQVVLEDGSTGFTRDGSFRLDADGRLAAPDGSLLHPPLSVPAGAMDLSVGRDGRVTARLPDQNAPVELGRLELASFANPAGLTAAGGGVYLESELSGPARTGFPGSDGFGEVVAGALEAANVDMAEELTQMLAAQRAYSFSLEALKTLDQMIASAIQFRR